jgi:uncharacterized membrane protein SpoIIM required for sporulation
MKGLLAAFLVCACLWTVLFGIGLTWTPSVDRVQASSGASSQEAAEWTLFSTQREAFHVILANNTRLALVAGAFTFGVTTVTSLAVGGLVTGRLVKRHIDRGMPVRTVLAYTLPHAAELIGLWLAGAVGLRGALYAAQLVRGRPARDQRTGAARTGAALVSLLAGALFVSLVIIAGAAWIEAYVTMDPLF